MKNVGEIKEQLYSANGEQLLRVMEQKKRKTSEGIKFSFILVPRHGRDVVELLKQEFLWSLKSLRHLHEGQ